MQTQLENLSPLERRLSIAVGLDEIDAEIQNRLKKLARTVKMHGFRPGKVPFRVVAQQYGGQVRQEVLGDTVQKTFGEAVRAQNLRVAGFPKFETKPPAEGAHQFEYSATFEVYPEVTVGSLADATISRPVLKVEDADADKTISILRQQRVTYRPVERAAQSGDQVVITFQGTIDGAEFEGGKGVSQSVVLGAGRLLADFENAIMGMHIGASKDFELAFPADYHGKEVAGKTAHFHLALEQVGEPVLPELDGDFAKSLGVADGDLTKMRQEVKANVEREVARRIKSKIKEQVMQALLDAAKLEVPKSLIQGEVERLMQGARQELQARGVNTKNVPIPPEVFEAQAQRRVSLGLVLGEVVKRQGLQAKPEQIRAVVEEQAQSYEHPEEVVKWYYQSPERLGEAESLVLEDNVVNWVLSTAKVTDQPVMFDEFMGKGQPT